MRPVRMRTTSPRRSSIFCRLAVSWRSLRRDRVAVRAARRRPSSPRRRAARRARSPAGTSPGRPCSRPGCRAARQPSSRSRTFRRSRCALSVSMCVPQCVYMWIESPQYEYFSCTADADAGEVVVDRPLRRVRHPDPVPGSPAASHDGIPMKYSTFRSNTWLPVEVVEDRPVRLLRDPVQPADLVVGPPRALRDLDAVAVEDRVGLQLGIARHACLLERCFGSICRGPASVSGRV